MAYRGNAKWPHTEAILQVTDYISIRIPPLIFWQNADRGLKTEEDSIKSDKIN